MEKTPLDKKTIGEKFGDKHLLTKKPQSSQKYANIKTTLDTGKTIKNVQILSDKFVSKRKNELFKRIKASTVSKLLEETKNTESIYNLGGDPTQESIYDMMSSKDESVSVYSHNTNLTSQTTTKTVVTMATEMLGDLSNIDFIILDLREAEDYDNYHIKEAVYFPAPNITRDKFTADIIKLDERSTIAAGGLLAQKGFENIFVITGGIEEFARDFPEKCEGKGVEALIKDKLQREYLAKEELMKKTQKMKKTITTTVSNVSSVKNGSTFDKPVSSKMSSISGLSKQSNTKSTISNLKNNLKK